MWEIDVEAKTAENKEAGIKMIFAENPDGTWDGRLSEPLKIPLLGAKTAARLAREAGEAWIEALKKADY